MPKNTLLHHLRAVRAVQSAYRIGDMLVYNQSTGISMRGEHTVQYMVYTTGSLNMYQTLSLLYVMQRLALVSGNSFDCMKLYMSLVRNSDVSDVDIGMGQKSFDFVLIEGEECDN